MEHAEKPILAEYAGVLGRGLGKFSGNHSQPCGGSNGVDVVLGAGVGRRVSLGRRGSGELSEAGHDQLQTAHELSAGGGRDAGVTKQAGERAGGRGYHGGGGKLQERPKNARSVEGHDLLAERGRVRSLGCGGEEGAHGGAHAGRGCSGENADEVLCDVG
jgi:hypothetical protein